MSRRRVPSPPHPRISQIAHLTRPVTAWPQGGVFASRPCRGRESCLLRHHAQLISLALPPPGRCRRWLRAAGGGGGRRASDELLVHPQVQAVHGGDEGILPRRVTAASMPPRLPHWPPHAAGRRRRSRVGPSAASAHSDDTPLWPPRAAIRHAPLRELYVASLHGARCVLTPRASTQGRARRGTGEDRRGAR